MSINRTPGEHGNLTIQGVGTGSKAITLQGDVTYAQPGTVHSDIDDVHSTEPKVMSKFSKGELNITAITDQPLDWIPNIIAETITFVSASRTLVFIGCILTQGDALPKANVVGGVTDELIIRFVKVTPFET